MVRNRIEPGLRILDVDEIAARNSRSLTGNEIVTIIQNSSTNPNTVSAADSFKYCVRPFDFPPTYTDIYPIEKFGHGVHV